MIANNIFKAVGEFCQNVLFAPYNSISAMDSWWLQNMVNWIFVVILFIALFYWLGQLKKYRKAENE